MKKFIKYRAGFANGRHWVKITEQSHKEEDFGKYDEKFSSSNGITLWSICFPQFDGYDIYVRGSDGELDNALIYFPSKEEFYLFKEAVNEYNKFSFKKENSELSLNKEASQKADVILNIKNGQISVIKNRYSRLGAVGTAPDGIYYLFPAKV